MARRPAPLLLALLGGFEEGRDVQERLDTEIRRIAHVEWLRTGNPDEFHNWNEAEKQLGGRLIHTGTVQWLHRELGSRERQLADNAALVRELEARCAELGDVAVRSPKRDVGGTPGALHGTEPAAEQAKLARCEARLRELEPALESQAAVLAQRNRHLAECDSYIQGLRATLERQEAEVCAVGVWETQCQDLESAFEANKAQLELRNEQFEQQDARIREVEAWLEDRRVDLERGFTQLVAQGQMLREHEERSQKAFDSSTVQASLALRIQDLESALAASRSELAARERRFEEGLEDAARELKAEVVERDRRLAAGAEAHPGQQAVEKQSRGEANLPPVLELKPWEGQSQLVYSKSVEDSVQLSREEELVVQREEALVREGRLAQQEAQAQALGSLLRARRVELDAKAYQLQVLQAQLAARDRRSLEQEQRAKQCEAHLQAQQQELTASGAELRKRSEELAAQRVEQRQQEERAAAEAKAQSEEVTSLRAELHLRDSELAEQLATERALVAHSARRRELEEQLVELGERRLLQQEEQAKALGSLLAARAAELEAKSGQLEAQSAQLDLQGRCLAEESLQAHCFESALGTLEEGLQAQHDRLEVQHQSLSKEGLRAGLLEIAVGQLGEELQAENWQRRESDARGRELQASLEAVSFQSGSEVEQLHTAQREVAEARHCASSAQGQLQARGEELTACEEQLQASTARSIELEVALEAQREELAVCEAHLANVAASEAQHSTSAQEHLQASASREVELKVALQAHQEEAAACEAQRLLHQTQLSALDVHLQASSSRAEEELRVRCDEIAALEARLQLQAAQHEEELTFERTTEGLRLGKLEERLAHLLDKLRRTSEEVVAANESRVAEPRKATPRTVTLPSASSLPLGLPLLSRLAQVLARAFFTVRGVDYTLLHAELQVLAGFKAALEQVLAVEAGPQVAPEDVALELWAGSVVVCASITPPAGECATSIEAQLRSSPTLPSALARSVAQVEGIERVSTGTLSVIVHNVRPEARPAGSTVGAAEGVTHRGNDGLTRQVSNPDAEELRFVECFSIGTPKRLVSGEPEALPEDGTVRKRVRELEGKQVPPPPDEQQTTGPGEATSGGATPSSALQRPSRICFRSRAYSPRLTR